MRYGETWSDSVIKYKYSRDNANSWTVSDLITFDKGMMVRSQPIRLIDGDILLPIYHETGHDKEMVGPDTPRHCLFDGTRRPGNGALTQ